MHRQLDRLAERYSAGEHKIEAMRAREEYFERAGKVFDDDAELFEGRMASFLEWYVLERPFRGGGGARRARRSTTPGAAGRASGARSRTSRRATAACSSCTRSTDRVLDLEDVLGGARFLVTERRNTIGFAAATSSRRA